MSCRYGAWTGELSSSLTSCQCFSCANNEKLSKQYVGAFLHAQESLLQPSMTGEKSYRGLPPRRISLQIATLCLIDTKLHGCTWPAVAAYLRLSFCRKALH